MKTLTLTRDDQNDLRTFGVLAYENGTRAAETIELPWADNAHDKSCIPAATYICELRYSPKHRYALFGVNDVPNRRDIEIHIDNVTATLLGCVGVGVTRGTLNGADAVLQSGVAFKAFMAAMGCGSYADLTSDEAVRGFKLAHPDAGKFTLIITDPPVQNPAPDGVTA